MRNLLPLVLCLLFSVSGLASHVISGSIRYDYIGPGATSGTFKYKLTAQIIRDCNGVRYSLNSLTNKERFWARCSASGTLIGPIQTTFKPYSPTASTGGGQDVSDVCRSVSTSCSGGPNTIQGYERLTVEAVIDLPRCNIWEIRLVADDCCRPSLTNFTNPNRVALEAQINTAWSNPQGIPENKSPVFGDNLRPAPIMCIGQDVKYAMGTYDPDGDSLTFVATCPWTSNSSSFNVNPFNSMVKMSVRSPYRCDAPVTGFKLDSSTGVITFRTLTSGLYTFAFYVNEYDRCSGILKGKTYREIVMSISSCSNNLPEDISGISALSSNATQLSSTEFEVCEGELVSWHDTLADPDVLDTLFIKSNVHDVLPGVKFTIQSLSRNRALIKFEWRADGQSGGAIKDVTVQFDDDRCNFPGIGYSTFRIRVKPSVYADSEIKSCLGDTTYLEAKGGNASSYTWQSLSGDPIIPGINWFADTTVDDTNKTAKFLPTQTTVLRLSTNLLRDRCGNVVTNACQLADTIKVVVADSFSIITSPDMTVCNPGSGMLSVTPSRSLVGYSYNWEPAGCLDSSQIATPRFTNLRESKTFTVNVVSDSGCAREASIRVNVTDPFPENMKLLASDTLICLQDTVDLSIDFGELDYGGCSASGPPCQGNFSDFTLGNGASTNAQVNQNFATTFGSQYHGSRVQYLYLAKDLKNLGMKGGPIRSIAWEIDSLYNNQTDTLRGFTIKIGCYSADDLPTTNGFIDNLLEVHSGKDIFLTKGWNSFTFDSDYNWSGNENLVIEVCWTNIQIRTIGQHLQTFDLTNYRSSMAYYQTSVTAPLVCTHDVLSPAYPNSTLPRTQFNACDGVRNTLLNYTWLPSTANFIGSALLDTASVFVNLNSPKVYSVVVEDSTYGVCKDTLSIRLNVTTAYDVKPDSIGPQCLSSGLIQLTSPTPYSISTPGGKWYGQGIVNDTLGIWDPNVSGVGVFWVKYEVFGDACAATDSTQIQVTGNPNMSIFSGDSACVLYTGVGSKNELLSNHADGWFTGYGVDSAIVGGSMKYWVDGSKFNRIPGGYDTAFVTYHRDFGCKDDSLYQIRVLPPWDSTYLGTMDYGSAYVTNTFCITSEIKDTLAVAGSNPTWSLLGTPAAMIDRNLGVLDPRIGGKNSKEPFVDTLVVGNYGFCGTENRIPILFDRAPEIEIIDKSYCYDFIEDPNNQFVNDTLYFRIAKGGGLGGNGQRSLGAAGNDTIAWYGDVAQTGWPGALTGVSNQYVHNFWNGNPWMPFPNIARYRPSSLTQGLPNEYTISYQLAVTYRSTHPQNRYCYSRDTGRVFSVPNSVINIQSTGDLCVDSTMTLDAGQRQGAIYTWNDGATGQTRTIRAPGTYYAYMDWYGCLDTGKIVVSNCVSVNNSFESGVSIQLFPNPTSGRVNLLVEGNG